MSFSISMYSGIKLFDNQYAQIVDNLIGDYCETLNLTLQEVIDISFIFDVDVETIETWKDFSPSSMLLAHLIKTKKIFLLTTVLEEINKKVGGWGKEYNIQSLKLLNSRLLGYVSFQIEQVDYPPQKLKLVILGRMLDEGNFKGICNTCNLNYDSIIKARTFIPKVAAVLIAADIAGRKYAVRQYLSRLPIITFLDLYNEIYPAPRRIETVALGALPKQQSQPSISRSEPLPSFGPRFIPASPFSLRGPEPLPGFRLVSGQPPPSPFPLRGPEPLPGFRLVSGQHPPSQLPPLIAPLSPHTAQTKPEFRPATFARSQLQPQDKSSMLLKIRGFSIEEDIKNHLLAFTERSGVYFSSSFNPLGLLLINIEKLLPKDRLKKIIFFLFADEQGTASKLKSLAGVYDLLKQRDKVRDDDVTFLAEVLAETNPIGYGETNFALMVNSFAHPQNQKNLRRLGVKLSGDYFNTQILPLMKTLMGIPAGTASNINDLCDMIVYLSQRAVITDTNYSPLINLLRLFTENPRQPIRAEERKEVEKKPAEKIDKMEIVEEKKAPKKEDVPVCFLCPITQEIMTDPVIDADGNSYEKSAILEWLRKSSTSPVTRRPLKIDDLRPNRGLKEAIEAHERAKK